MSKKLTQHPSLLSLLILRFFLAYLLSPTMSLSVAVELVVLIFEVVNIITDRECVRCAVCGLRRAVCSVPWYHWYGRCVILLRHTSCANATDAFSVK